MDPSKMNLSPSSDSMKRTAAVRLLAIVFLSLLPAHELCAQGPPPTDIFLTALVVALLDGGR